jgi:ribosome maturation factor RimP
LVGVDLETVVRPVVEGAGLELVEVTFRRESGRKVLRVTADRDGGLDLDTIAEIAEKVSRRLDLEGFAEGPYELEVSSPGIERPLRTPAHFRRFVGERVKVKTTQAADEAHVHEGVLIAADDEGITLDVGGEHRHIAYAGIASARSVADWAAELKGSKA